MKLGAFSISLSVKDIHASLAFYTELGFESLGGNAEDNWAIIKNEDTKTVAHESGQKVYVNST